MQQSMLTTIDNPYDPFTNYNAWYAYDSRMRYNTSGFLARVVVTSNELSEDDQQLAIERAIDEIVKENVTGLYKKITRDKVVKL